MSKLEFQWSNDTHAMPTISIDTNKRHRVMTVGPRGRWIWLAYSPEDKE